MKQTAIRIAVLLIVAACCNFYLHNFERRTGNAIDKQTVGVGTWLIRALNLKDLAVGFLWLRFDTDTVFQLANHHRLLITLDAITAIKEDEFDAWSLKNFMRLDRAVKKKDEEMKKRALHDYRLACLINPIDWRFFHDAAQTIFKRLDDIDQAMEYAQKACSMPESKLVAKRLLALIYFEKEMLAESAILYREILESDQSDASEKKVAQRMLDEIEQRKK
ncbi:MAG: hypothetical protein ACOYXC_06385 [Candidatus Rifleibacteriota bacterium]